MFPKGDIVAVISDLSSGNTFPRHVMGKRGLSDRNDSGGGFVDFCCFHRLAIGGTMFKQGACHKVNGLQLTDTEWEIRLTTWSLTFIYMLWPRCVRYFSQDWRPATP